MVLLAPLLLTLAALWAACAVAARTGGHEGPRGVAERGVLFFALLVAPPWALGWLGAFTPVALALGSAATSALTALAATGGQPARLRAAARDAGALLAAPFRGPVELARRGAWLGAAAWALALLVAGWVALLTWLAPSTSWDGMWYHDTMVGFAVQHRGFAWVDLPEDGMQVVNGYPRLVESVAAFFVALGDDRWIELPALLFWPLLGAALADLAGNFTDWREGRVLFAVLMLTMPGVALELRSTYVDIPIAFLLVVALASLTRPRLGLRDLWIAALATGLLAGAKSTAAVIVPLLFALALVRLRPLTREEGRRVLGPLLAGGALVAAFAAPLYLRNALRTGNPFWPLTLESSLLGLEFEGPIEVVVAWPPVDVWLREMYGAPMQGMYHPDVRPHGYGHALPFLLPPLLLFALPAGLRALARGSRRARAGLALAAATAGLVLATREVMWWGRFGAVPVAAVLALLVGWMAAPRHRPWARRLLALAVAVHAATLVWAEPGWGYGVEEARRLATMSPAMRSAYRVGELFPEPATLARLEREVGRGDVVAFAGNVGFLSLAWNHRMDNRVERVRGSGAGLLEELEAMDARWLVTSTRDWRGRGVERDPRWERVGLMAVGMVGYARRSEGEARGRVEAGAGAGAEARAEPEAGAGAQARAGAQAGAGAGAGAEAEAEPEAGAGAPAEGEAEAEAEAESGAGAPAEAGGRRAGDAEGARP